MVPEPRTLDARREGVVERAVEHFPHGYVLLLVPTTYHVHERRVMGTLADGGNPPPGRRTPIFLAEWAELGGEDPPPPPIPLESQNSRGGFFGQAGIIRRQIFFFSGLQ